MSRLAGFRFTMKTAMLSAAFLAFTAPGAFGIDSGKQILVGGGVTVGDSINYTAPGLSVVFNYALFGGDDAAAAQLRMPAAGTINTMRLRIVTQNVASGGGFLFQVLKNGVATGMICNIPPPATKSANCTSSQAVGFNAGDRISIKIDTDFFGAGEVAFTHVFVID